MGLIQNLLLLRHIFFIFLDQNVFTGQLLIIAEHHFVVEISDSAAENSFFEDGGVIGLIEHIQI